MTNSHTTTNTKLINHDFVYHSPDTLDDALKCLGEPGAVVLAGGTDLINKLKLETAHPSTVVFIGDVGQLHNFTHAAGLSIGAMVTMSAVERSPVVRRNYTCLYEAVHSVGGQQIRNTATLAGNVGNASPAADAPPALAVLGAQCELGMIGKNGEIEFRTVSVEQIFSGPGKTIMRPGEIIVSITVPEPPSACGSSFQKNGRVKLDVAKASAAAFLHRDGDTCAELRIAAGSVAPTMVRASTVEQALRGRKMSMQAVIEASGKIAKDIAPISDVRSTDCYRSRVMNVLVRDAILEAWKRAEGEKLV
ncbi:MAG: xanthine dehydrogenase family protein subunit M [Spirochaetia bacterium]|nr:xanthine dehydrogenase family protein subunit M [Spirochaetia bacterium]